MKCSNCGNEILEGAAFCPHCGNRIAEETAASDVPVYQTEVKGLRKTGKLTVYRDRTEFATSSVQRTIYSYSNLVAVKKRPGLSLNLDHIDFITEDGQTESCDVNRKTIHEAFLYIEKAAAPYIARRRERLLSQGIHYSIISSIGLTNGILNISDSQAEFKSKSGQSEIVFFQDVKSVRVYGGIKSEMLEFLLINRTSKTFGIDKELRDEVFSFVVNAVEPYIEERKEALLAKGIYFSSFSSLGSVDGILNILEDRAEFTSKAEQNETVFFKDVRTVSLFTETLELSLTDGTSKAFVVEKDIREEILSFIQNAIQPYVQKRTEGFHKAFGIDEQIEINEERGVFHILRQGGKEISEEAPLSSIVKCEQTECSESSGVLDKSIDIFNLAAKAVGAQNKNTLDADEKISYVGILLTVRTEQGEYAETVRFGDFFVRMSRTNEKYSKYLEEVSKFMDYLGGICPECELIVPALPEKPQEDASEGIPQSADGNETQTALIAASRQEEAFTDADAASETDRTGILKYIEGVSGFINSCTTPMTIAIQGSGGIRKNSTMRMLFASLEKYCPNDRIWFDARQPFTSDTEKSLLELVGKELISLLSGTEDNASKERTAKITKSFIGLVTGIVASDSQVGRDLADELLFKGTSAIPPGKLVDAFNGLVRERTGRSGGRIVILISNLDKLAPARTVELLKIMREFFDCDECVFVAAIDYGFFLRGAMENPDIDDQKGKALFDEIFQMFFQMPASEYDVRKYAMDKLEHMNISTDDEELDFYDELIQQSVGGEPRNMDRLFNSFLLLKNMTDSNLYESKIKRLILFALLCMQESFPAVYVQLIQMKGSMVPALISGLCSADSEVVSNCGLNEEEAERFQAFAQVFCDIIDMDDSGNISGPECDMFVRMLELSSITSK